MVMGSTEWRRRLLYHFIQFDRHGSQRPLGLSTLCWLSCSCSCRKRNVTKVTGHRRFCRIFWEDLHTMTKNRKYLSKYELRESLPINVSSRPFIVTVIAEMSRFLPFLSKLRHLPSQCTRWTSYLISMLPNDDLDSPP
jgi:hypothetical protein